MQSLNFDHCGLEAITEQELITIDGGHEGIAYTIGHTAGQFIVALGACAAVVAILL